MPSILTINGGSSSFKFAVYQAGEPLERRFHGKIDRIGLSGTVLTYAAMRLEIENDRWQGVPFFLRAGKCLPITCTEVVFGSGGPQPGITDPAEDRSDVMKEIWVYE